MAMSALLAGAVLLLAARSAAAAAAPSALDVPATEWWDGNDGPWSSFVLSVGTPKPTSLRLLVSNTAPMPWVLHSYYACLNRPARCANDRGGVFDNTTSTSWNYTSLNTLFDFTVSAEGIMGYSGNGAMGQETVGFGWADSIVGTINNQLIAITDGGGQNNPDPHWNFYTGMIGLFPRPVNLSEYTQSYPSMLQNLKARGNISSLSWGYTAGMVNYASKSYGSLTLGGYDTTRFIPNGVSFPFGRDQSFDLELWVNSIETNNVVNSQASKTLSDSRFQATIDFTLPYLWLPESVCSRFEAAFGLVKDSKTGLYLVNGTQHKALKATNPNVTFTLGSDSFSETVKITLPYTALDLNVSSPIVPESTFYFPLKSSEKTFILGRAFMQNAYVIADYSDKRNNFTVAEALHPPTGTTRKLVTIYPPGEEPKGSKLGIGAIVGIAVGSVAVIAIVGISAWFIYRKKRAAAEPAAQDDDNYHFKPELEANEVDHTKGKFEADGVTNVINELGDNIVANELMDGGKDSKVHEMEESSTPVVYEMPAEDVILPELESNTAGTPLPGPGEEIEVVEKPPRRERFSYED